MCRDAGGLVTLVAPYLNKVRPVHLVFGTFNPSTGSAALLDLQSGRKYASGKTWSWSPAPYSLYTIPRFQKRRGSGSRKVR